MAQPIQHDKRTEIDLPRDETLKDELKYRYCYIVFIEKAVVS